MPLSSDLTFITNEAGASLRDRFHVLLGSSTRFFDCLVGYFFISGFHRLYPALEQTEKIRVLIGLKTDRRTYDLLQQAKAQPELFTASHAETKEQIPQEVLRELEQSDDTASIERGWGSSLNGVVVGNSKSRFTQRCNSMPSSTL